jgi:hypothetical protein
MQDRILTTTPLLVCFWMGSINTVAGLTGSCSLCCLAVSANLGTCHVSGLPAATQVVNPANTHSSSSMCVKIEPTKPVEAAECKCTKYHALQCRVHTHNQQWLSNYN